MSDWLRLKPSWLMTVVDVLGVLHKLSLRSCSIHISVSRISIMSVHTCQGTHPWLIPNPVQSVHTSTSSHVSYMHDSIMHMISTHEYTYRH